MQKREYQCSHRIDQGTMWIEKNIWSKATLRPRHIFCWPQNAHHLRGRFLEPVKKVETFCADLGPRDYSEKKKKTT